MHVFLEIYHRFPKILVDSLQKKCGIQGSQNDHFIIILSIQCASRFPPQKNWVPPWETHNLPSVFRGSNGVITNPNVGGCKSLIFFPCFFWGPQPPAGCTYRPPSACVWEVMEESLVDCPAKKKTIGGQRPIVTERWGPKKTVMTWVK